MELAPDSFLWKYYNHVDGEVYVECKLCKRRLKNNKYGLTLHIKKLHTNRDEVNKYYDINELENSAVCRTCNQRLKNRLCNLRLHMRRLHNIVMNVPEDKPDVKKQRVPWAAKRKMPKQDTDKIKRRPHCFLIQMDRRTIVRSVIGLIIEDGISPHFLDSKHFDVILSPMRESISDKEGKEFKIKKAEIETIINLMANNIRNDFSNDLNCRLLSIKIDNDLNGLANTFCVTAVFVSDCELQTRILGLINLQNNSKLQENHIKCVLHKYNIDSNQIISGFWDNSKSKYGTQVRNSEYINAIEIFNSYPEIFLGDVKIESYYGSLAQKCLLEIFKNPKILQPFLECRNLAKFVADERNGYLELFKLNNVTPPHMDSPYNAGSTCKMMNSLLEARNFLQAVKFEKLEEAGDQFNYNDNLWLFIEAFCNATNYWQKAILKFYSEDLHIGDFYAQWLKCKHLTEKLAADNENPNDYLSTILNEIVKCIDNITSELLSKDRVTACLHLDPRFQHIMNLDQKNIAIEYLTKLWCRSKLYTDDDIALNGEVDHLFDDDENTFLNEFLTHDLQVKDKSNNDIFKKIGKLKLPFQTPDTNILTFWKGKKTSDLELYTLCMICFAIPATQNYTTPHYSHMYRMNNKSDVSEFTKENILNLRLNAHLLDVSLLTVQLTNDNHSDNSSDNEADCFDLSVDEDSNAASTSAAISGVAPNSPNADTKPSIQCHVMK